MYFNKLNFVLSAVIALTSMSSAANVSDKLKQKLEGRSANAALILHELVKTPDNAPVKALLKNSSCVMVVPSVTKIAFIGGGRYGRGLVSCRTAQGWSDPIFVALSGGSVGFQAGISSTDLVLIFNRANAPITVSQPDLTLGGNATVAAGPFGRDLAAGTDIRQFTAEIYAYSQARGLFAGVALDGSKIQPDMTAIREIYNDDANPKELVLTPAMPGTTPSQVQSFINELNSTDLPL
jgi:lipid-binding SYLF domain-containing protein